MAEKKMTRAQALTAAIAYAEQDGNAKCVDVLSRMLTSITKPRKTTTTKTRVLNESLAKQVVEQFAPNKNYTAKEIVDFNLSGVGTPQKAVAVLHTAKDMGLITAEKQGKRNTYKLAE